MNDRLRDRLKSPIVKGQSLIQSLGAALLGVCVVRRYFC
jgi:hypothetical protein